MRRFVFAAAFVGLLSLLAPPASAEGEGQADLDAATDLQVGAESLADLEKVSDLIETALKKGLDKGQQDFAKRMLAATLYQHADRLSKAIFEQKPPTRNWQLVRQHALKDLEKAKQNDANLPDVHLLLTRLHAELPGGDEKIAKQSIDQAVKLLKDNPKQQAAAYVLRGKIVQGLDEKLENFDAACRADPESMEALQARAIVYLQK